MSHGYPTRLFAAASRKKKVAPAEKKGGGGGFGGGGRKGARGARKAVWKGVPIEGPDVSEFYSWLEKHGVDKRRVTLADFDGLRGVMAVEDIPAGDPIVTVPYEATLDLGRALSADPTEAAVTFLRDFFLTAAGEPVDSATRPYLAMIPAPNSSDCTTTDFFSEKELGMLQCPTVVEETRARAAALQRTMIGLTSSAAIIPGLSEDTLRWATWVVVSRVLTVQGTPSADGVAPPSMHKLLIPFIDMFNHHAGAKGAAQVLSGRAVPGGSMKVLAGESGVRAGEQVFIQYGGGTIGSARFLQDYGFLDRFLPGGGPTSSSARADEEAVAYELADADIEALAATTTDEDEAALKQEGLSPCEALAVAFRLALKQTEGYKKRAVV